MSLFSKIFVPSQARQPVDFGELVTDFHSHLIPGIDDGCQTIEDSVLLIRQFAGMGFRKLITTPHIQDEFYRNTPEIIMNGLRQVREAVKEAGISIQIDAAAEYLIDDGFEKKIREGNLLTFGQRHILVEMSYFMEHPNLKSVLFQLQVNGYKVILAHPERYSYWNRQWNRFEELREREILFQLNTVSLSGHYGMGVKKMAEQLIEKGMYDFMGSDVHNQEYMDSFQKSRSENMIKLLLDSGKIQNNQL